MPIITWKIGAHINQHNQGKILLQVDQQTIALWRHHPSGKQQCIKTTDRSQMRQVRLVYTHGTTGQKCHIEVANGHYNAREATSRFLIGHRSFWLSRGETEWLAQELSMWMKLPVREVEIRSSNV